MDARNPVCRFALLACALAAAPGCQSAGGGPVARGQVPQEPLGPIAPPPPPELTNAIPLAPAQGAVPAIPGAPVPGSPVPPEGKGPVVSAGYTGAVKAIPSAAEMLKNGVPRVKVVAVVGANNVITDREVLESVHKQFAADPELAALPDHERRAKVRELYTLALRRTIERELILDAMYGMLRKANKMSMVDELRERSRQRADAQLVGLKKMMRQTDEGFDAELRALGLTRAVLRRQFEREFMAQAYLEEVLRGKARRAGLAEIRDYYDRHPEEFERPDRVKWQHIFVSLHQHRTPEEAYRHAEALRRNAADGGDFAALAKQYDEGLARMQNGFGTGELRGKIQPPDLEPTVWSLKPGQMSGVLQTATGYHIVKVVERQVAGVEPFDIAVQGKIRDKLNKGLMEAEAKKIVDDLWRKGVVRVMEE
jgi:parvulin-like peptidyl-prolyl isomerase